MDSALLVIVTRAVPRRRVKIRQRRMIATHFSIAAFGKLHGSKFETVNVEFEPKPYSKRFARSATR